MTERLTEADLAGASLVLLRALFRVGPGRAVSIALVGPLFWIALLPWNWYKAER
jgi:hypothetical protein